MFFFLQEDLFALEKESTPADLEAQREASRALQEELHAAVVARIKNRDNPPPVAVNCLDYCYFYEKG